MIVDTRGCSCPQPILMTKNALKKESSIEVLTDNPTAKENVIRFAENQGYTTSISENTEGEYTISIHK